jgi:hypothetical protein
MHPLILKVVRERLDAQLRRGPTKPSCLTTKGRTSADFGERWRNLNLRQFHITSLFLLVFAMVAMGMSLLRILGRSCNSPSFRAYSEAHESVPRIGDVYLLRD